LSPTCGRADTIAAIIAGAERRCFLSAPLAYAGEA
jgi:hypothetical protein